MTSTFTQVLVFVCGLIMGTGSTVTIKVVYDTKVCCCCCC